LRLVHFPFGCWVVSRLVVFSYFDLLAYLIFLGFWSRDFVLLLG